MLFLKKIAWVFVLYILSVSHSYANNTTLTIFNWAHYLSDDVVHQWQNETGVPIEQAFYDDDVERDRIINRRSHRILDIAILDEISSHNFLENGKVLDLTKYDIPNRKYIPELWQDQCGDAGIPYFWGTLGLVYRKDLFPTPPNSWWEILSPKPEHRKHIIFMSDYTDMFMPSLFTMGVALSSTDANLLKAVYHQLEQLIPDVLAFDYVLSYAESNPHDLKNIHLAMAYSGDEEVLNSLDAEYEWGFVTPSEGTIVWVDCLAVFSQSQHIDDAIKFIDYLTRPEISAQNARDVGNSTANDEALRINQVREGGNDMLTVTGQLPHNPHYYNEIRRVSMTLKHRIASSIIKQHEQHNHENK
ncbi:spermidine/putrescine ABC transporter substrate-binding protein [Vibrio aquaticus]|uniref:Spermidine/putrescine ABC transporter substrate-binding protein n=1 Tax=Vibrio aquaticus TaxID=2496559 RepID=A0A3S0N890_9VIBR|nr:spermidine/putrescine ABC transporter substrate-binding protein [Vibrio aquaticus]RTZ18206.1 spermidine/putrescine ABC transporter substrate-binding protein [Vibrio aquaticus]